MSLQRYIGGAIIPTVCVTERKTDGLKTDFIRRGYHQDQARTRTCSSAVVTHHQILRCDESAFDESTDTKRCCSLVSFMEIGAGKA